MRYHLTPGEPVRITFDPWGHELICRRSLYTGERAAEIRVRIGRLKQSLSWQAEASEDPQAAEITAWLDLERDIGSQAWSDGRFAPPPIDRPLDATP